MNNLFLEDIIEGDEGDPSQTITPNGDAVDGTRFLNEMEDRLKDHMNQFNDTFDKPKTKSTKNGTKHKKLTKSMAEPPPLPKSSKTILEAITKADTGRDAQRKKEYP